MQAYERRRLNTRHTLDKIAGRTPLFNTTAVQRGRQAQAHINTMTAEPHANLKELSKMTAAVDPRRRGEQRRLRQRVNTNKTQPGRQRNRFPPCGTASNKKMAELLQKLTSGTRRIDTETSSDPVRPDKAGRDTDKHPLGKRRAERNSGTMKGQIKLGQTRRDRPAHSYTSGMKPAQWHGGDNRHVSVHYMQGGDSHQEIETYHHHRHRSRNRNRRLEEDTSQQSVQSKSTGPGGRPDGCIQNSPRQYQ